MSRLPDNKSICSKYGLEIDDPIVQRRNSKKSSKKAQRQTTKNLKVCAYRTNQHKKGSQRYVPKNHYYEPNNIHLKTQRQDGILCWLCGQKGHTTNKFPKGKESNMNRGKKSQEVAS